MACFHVYACIHVCVCAGVFVLCGGIRSTQKVCMPSISRMFVSFRVKAPAVWPCIHAFIRVYPCRLCGEHTGKAVPNDTCCIIAGTASAEYGLPWRLSCRPVSSRIEPGFSNPVTSKRKVKHLTNEACTDACWTQLEQARNHEYTDARFEIDGLLVASAHKSVLASRSPVFAGMFRSVNVEGVEGVVVIQGVTAQSLVAFIELLYLGTFFCFF
jgi:hypothetical protein